MTDKRTPFQKVVDAAFEKAAEWAVLRIEAIKVNPPPELAGKLTEREAQNIIEAEFEETLRDLPAKALPKRRKAPPARLDTPWVEKPADDLGTYNADGTPTNDDF